MSWENKTKDFKVDLVLKMLCISLIVVWISVTHVMKNVLVKDEMKEYKMKVYKLLSRAPGVKNLRQLGTPS